LHLLEKNEAFFFEETRKLAHNIMLIFFCIEIEKKKRRLITVNAIDK